MSNIPDYELIRLIRSFYDSRIDRMITLCQIIIVIQMLTIAIIIWK